uniref:Ci-LF-2 receptor n=1 Tax=Ciona intestinalis TaxID=7719 RepID=A0A1W5BPN7_CIOIN|nr:uncharacterized protein LOC108951013 [Ciona intestinalis]BBC53702.1 Ci-LF-2 receptor [Ciona intestinalis]|eukprot:XP_018672924.2 uncharacterized protein LOC108951013 [Ciona intestinalis]
MHRIIALALVLIQFTTLQVQGLGEYMTIYSLVDKIDDIRRNESLRLETCEIIHKNYTAAWSSGGNYISEYLSIIEDLNCTFFKEECEQRVYAFTTFSSLHYDRSCNRSKFESQCFSTLFLASSARGTNISNWNELLRDLRTLSLTNEELYDPCIQVALYDAAVQERGKYGYYHEMKNAFAPFCGLTWCGFDAENLNKNPLSIWFCMASGCKSKTFALMAICGVLALVTFCVNLTVVFVFLLNDKLRNSQGIYKMSLASSDVVVGAIVIPSFAITIFLFSVKQETMGAAYTQRIQMNVSNSSDRYDSVPHLPGGYLDNKLPPSYRNAIGFFTFLSLTVSVYTLLLAGFDRLAVVRKPLKYSRDTAKKQAVRATTCMWGFTIIISCLPFFIDTLNYGLVASTLISVYGLSALYVYIVVFSLPLLVIWITSISTLVLTRSHSKTARSMMTGTMRSQIPSTEYRLARTLGLMVGVFTLSLLPVLIVIVASFFISGLNTRDPENLNLFNSQAYSSAEFTALLILVCNSVWNFFIYSGRNKDFRLATGNMFNRLATKVGLAKCAPRLSRAIRRTFSSSSSKSHEQGSGRHQMTDTDETRRTSLQSTTNKLDITNTTSRASIDYTV